MKWKISKRKLLLLAVFSILALTPFLIYLLSAGGGQPADTPDVPEITNSPSLVVPETPLGTLALLGSTMMALLVYLTVKKRR
jgi:hypothetical protein